MIDKILHKIYDFILSFDKSYGVKNFTQKETVNIQEKLLINLIRKSKNTLFGKIEKDCSKIHKDLSNTIKTSLKEIEKNWPKKLPSGIIHADLFPDNIFFKKDKFTGIIDFYFSCHDFYSFEIAVCLNALCFDGVKQNLSFNVTKAKKLMEGYNEIRKTSFSPKTNG